jgi:hypothetical protein
MVGLLGAVAVSGRSRLAGDAKIAGILGSGKLLPIRAAYRKLTREQP